MPATLRRVAAGSIVPASVTFTIEACQSQSFHIIIPHMHVALVQRAGSGHWCHVARAAPKALAVQGSSCLSLPVRCCHGCDGLKCAAPDPRLVCR